MSTLTWQQNTYWVIDLWDENATCEARYGVEGQPLTVHYLGTRGTREECVRHGWYHRGVGRLGPTCSWAWECCLDAQTFGFEPWEIWVVAWVHRVLQQVELSLPKQDLRKSLKVESHRYTGQHLTGVDVWVDRSLREPGDYTSVLYTGLKLTFSVSGVRWKLVLEQDGDPVSSSVSFNPVWVNLDQQTQQRAASFLLGNLR